MPKAPKEKPLSERIRKPPRSSVATDKVVARALETRARWEKELWTVFTEGTDAGERGHRIDGDESEALRRGISHGALLRQLTVDATNARRRENNLLALLCGAVAMLGAVGGYGLLFGS